MKKNVRIELKLCSINHLSKILMTVLAHLIRWHFSIRCMVLWRLFWIYLLYTGSLQIQSDHSNYDFLTFMVVNNSKVAHGLW